MTTPSRTGATAQGSYNEAEIAYWDGRLATIEQRLGIDTRVRPGALAVSSSTETILASGAVSIQTINSSLDATSGNQTNTLATPAADGHYKVIQMTAAGGHTATVSGTNIQGQSGKVGTFSAAADSLVLLSVGGLWVKIGGNVAFGGSAFLAHADHVSHP